MKTTTLSLFIFLFSMVSFGQRDFVKLTDDGEPNFKMSIEYNGKLFFENKRGFYNSELWTIDGTASVVEPFKAKRTSWTFIYPNSLIEFNNQLFFEASDGNGGSRLYKSDGTEINTEEIKKIRVRQPIIFQDKIFFQGNENMFGSELWTTNGTESGTSLVKDILPGTNGSAPSDFIIVGNRLIFIANDGTNGEELWATDGTLNGTMMLKDIRNGNGGITVRNKLVINNMLYFTADAYDSGEELWLTNGTEAGTRLLKDIRPGSSRSVIRDFFEYNGILFFTADDGTHGRELWMSGGTDALTAMVKDIHPTASSDPDNFIIYNNKIYFSATHPTYGREIWESDGSASGTKLAVDIFPGSQTGYGPFSSSPKHFTPFKGELYFSVADRILAKTDGTAEGTKLIKTINSTNIRTPIDNPLDNLIVYNDKLYFRADDGSNGYELWESDGTEDGTVKIKPNNTNRVNPLEEDPQFRIYNNALYFVASFTNTLDPVLWKLSTLPTPTSTKKINHANQGLN
ncbi:MAG: hypothetical protein GX102_11300 [Porphyromonadaceae bacterium]|nr:hypothetical protein [Porphyromonadaceae bacterium]